MRKYTEQELEQIREEYMDKAAFTAPEEVRKALNELHEAFNAYLDACLAFEFNNVLGKRNRFDVLSRTMSI